MKNKIFLSEKRKPSGQMLTRLSGIFGMSFMLILLALFSTQCKEDDFKGEVVGVCPEVILTSPINGAINVITTKVITANFNVNMDPTTVNETTFTLKKAGNLVSGAVKYSGVTATFIPTNLLTANTVYSATIIRNVTDLMGNIMRKDTTWSFNTGAIPVVVLTDPLQGASDVALNKAITADFSTAMNPTTINASSFILKQGANLIAGTVTYVGVKATFTPTVSLLTNKVYTATITKNAADLAGNTMARDTTWSFATGVLPIITLTDPLNGATNVSVNRKVNVTFSKTMSMLSINPSTFTLKQGTNLVSGLITYKDMTATFTPTADLLPGTEYTATVTTGVKDLLNNSIVKDSTWKFTTSVLIIPILPYVVSTDPAHLAVDVAYNKAITATFSKAMDPTTINSSTFKVMNGSTAVLGYITYSGLVGTFTPAAPLLPNTVYTATITTGVKDIDGNAMAANKVWSFTTIAPVLPYVVSTDPKNLDTNVALDKLITATFNKTMNATTINSSTFLLMNGLTPVSGVVTYVGMVATFNPTSTLIPGTVYTATVTNSVKDLEGNAMAVNKIWSFTSLPVAPINPYVISTDPKNLDTNVALDKSITATFSKVMNPATINSSTFILMNGLIPVSGVVTYVGTVGTFNPNATLIPGTVYTATVTNGVKDMDGNAMVVNKVWSFTSMPVAPVSPYIVSTDPSNLATNVALDKSITATFSKPMNPTTVNSTSFILMNGLIPVPGNVTYVGLVGTFNPTAPLTQGTLYTATVTNSVKDLEGNAMVNNKTWSFTTMTPIVKYTVTLVSFPVDGGTTLGAGQYDANSTVTVKATAKAGYSFVNWTDAGLEASKLANYTFEIKKNTTLMANFKALAAGPLTINLDCAAPYAIMAGSTITSTGPSVIKGDVALSPGTALEGFPPGIIIGVKQITTPDAAAAKLCLTAAFNDGMGRSLNAISLPGQLGGLTLAPGLYSNSSTSGISGTGANGILTLDAGGNPNATWIFKMGSTFVTDPGTSVVLAGGAQAKNIFWVVGTSATLGTTSVLYGNILAQASISLKTGATLYGRALTQTAAVSLEASTITKP